MGGLLCGPWRVSVKAEDERQRAGHNLSAPPPVPGPTARPDVTRPRSPTRPLFGNNSLNSTKTIYSRANSKTAMTTVHGCCALSASSSAGPRGLSQQSTAHSRSVRSDDLFFLINIRLRNSEPSGSCSRDSVVLPIVASTLALLVRVVTTLLARLSPE